MSDLVENPEDWFSHNEAHFAVVLPSVVIYSHLSYLGAIVVTYNQVHFVL